MSTPPQDLMNKLHGSKQPDMSEVNTQRYYEVFSRANEIAKAPYCYSNKTIAACIKELLAVCAEKGHVKNVNSDGRDASFMFTSCRNKE